jgi:anti-anti-sigma factor
MELIVAVVTVLYPGASAPSLSLIPDERRRAWLATGRISSCTVIAALGDIDAGNADDVGACVTGHLDACNQLLLDLSGLKFFAIQGFSMLHDVRLGCARRGIPWILVPSLEVRRVLSICDPDAILPLAPSATAGQDALDGRLRPRLQLV